MYGPREPLCQKPFDEWEQGTYERETIGRDENREDIAKSEALT